MKKKGLRDHPRRCGENLCFQLLAVTTAGSPPQVRGKHEGCQEFVHFCRITPAGAGKTASPLFIAASSSDHPRRCGENRKGVDKSDTVQGSPPQVRGKLIQAIVDALPQRITPAGAGKTSPRKCEHVQTQDHPRRCGENNLSHVVDLTGSGSPPQVRGKRHRHEHHTCCIGITPAGAGKTAALNQRIDIFQDHPRRCGENINVGCKVKAQPGSPPQVRGKLTQKAESLFLIRITPAGAGKTSFRL